MSNPPTEAQVSAMLDEIAPPPAASEVIDNVYGCVVAAVTTWQASPDGTSGTDPQLIEYDEETGAHTLQVTVSGHAVRIAISVVR